MDKGHRVITQKMCQTGCEGIAEDIITHRQLMGTGILDEDNKGKTCAYTFKYPASPHLAAAMEGATIDINKIDELTMELEKENDIVLLEGAGGLMVPITEDYTSLEFLKDRNYPVILVTSSKLGSINHTLLSLEVMKAHGLKLEKLVFNHYPCNSEVIFQDSRRILKEYLKKYFPEAEFKELSELSLDN